MPQAFERQVLHRGRKFDFEIVTFPTRDGGSAKLEVVRHPGAVVVVPLLEGARVALIRNLRPAVGSTLWEFPAGTLEPGEGPAKAAARELEEETGYAAGSIIPLGDFYTTPGMTNELMHAFLAADLRKTAQNLEQDETIEVHPVTLAHAFDMIDRAELADAKSILALLLAQRKGLLPEGQGR